MTRYLAWILVCISFTLPLSGQQVTTVSDIFVDSNGDPIPGPVTITSARTITGSDGFILEPVSQMVMPDNAGRFTVDLVPNIGASPPGTLYDVTFISNGREMKERWVVRPSSTPLTRNDVRVPDFPQVSDWQLLPPEGCKLLDFMQWKGTKWSCASPTTAALKTGPDGEVPNSHLAHPASGTGAYAPANASYWLRTANGALTNATVLGKLATGLILNTNTTGVPTIYPGHGCGSGNAVTALDPSGNVTCAPFIGGTGNNTSFLPVWTAANTLGQSSISTNMVTGQANLVPLAGQDAPAFTASPSVAGPTSPVIQVFADAGRTVPALWIDPVTGRNHWAGQQLNLGGAATLGSGSFPALILTNGGNSTSWTSGTGSPALACNAATNGSLYSRIDGIRGQTLYVCEAGTWNTVNTTLGTALPAGSVAPARKLTAHQVIYPAPTATAAPSLASRSVPARQAQSGTSPPTTTASTDLRRLHHPVGQKP